MKKMKTVIMNNDSTTGVDSNIANNKPEDMLAEEKMGGKYRDPDLFSADRLIDKMSANLEAAEAATHEHPLRTENTPNDQ